MIGETSRTPLPSLIGETSRTPLPSLIGETSRTPLPSLPSGPSIRVMLDGGGFSTGSVHLSPEAMIPGDDSGLDEESAEEIDDTMKW